LPAPFCDNIYFGTIYFRVSPSYDVEGFLNELRLLEIKKDIKPKILTDITLNTNEVYEDDASSEDLEEDDEYDPSENDEEVDEVSEDDDDSHGGDMFED
jgi:hypothetical protein